MRAAGLQPWQSSAGCQWMCAGHCLKLSTVCVQLEAERALLGAAGVCLSVILLVAVLFSAVASLTTPV